MLRTWRLRPSWITIDSMRLGAPAPLSITLVSLTSAGAVRRPSIDDAPRQALELVLVGHAEHAHLVLALDAVARMRELRREIAVARQESSPSDS